MPNPWVEHVKRKAQEFGLSYGCAISDARVKESYVRPEKKTKAKAKAKSTPASTPVPEVKSFEGTLPEKKMKKILPKTETFDEAIDKVMKKNLDATEDFIMRSFVGIVNEDFPWETRSEKLEQMYQVINKKVKSKKQDRGKYQDLRDEIFDVIDKFKVNKTVDTVMDQYALKYLINSGMLNL